ncbi:SDR family oxidoreductase [Rhizobium oryzihabitans]|uniref:SDR family oxidoreductase n=1 Tax=Rhizobium oryzihabitans TaxID=2267833 RepID=A0A7L5BQT9_9HYPH|nr:SDR family oxidoreductase [Rhizobium oryzihabitans]QCM08038.1 SDR family oxidoreductase [Agrobacterium tumefaciens]QIB41006.1 SDR family oxidoreductase [Rhizobium oryzihabitans]CUX46652.1 Short chain dehydrogenase [Agrobacterium genomosp. 5 str. CFBP 6626]
MTTPSVLIIGARSDIGKAVAHKFAAAGYAIQMAARNVESLDIDKRDIELRYGAKVTLHEFDVLSVETHEEFVSGLPQMPDVAISTIGLMGQQEKSERDPVAAGKVMRSNYEGPASILALLANHFEQRASGTLVGISSVAGERGRATNYVYGSAKAAFTAFLSGLRNRLAKRGVHVVTVLPGFVATKMTEGMDLPAALTADPKEVAIAIERAVLSKKNVVYVRPIWQLIMMIIRNIPERFFKTMKL